MVTETEREEMTWFQCDECGLLFGDADDAERHESNCTSENDPSYLQ